MKKENSLKQRVEIFLKTKTSPQKIHTAIIKIPFVKVAIHSFSVQFAKDNFRNKKVKICFELKDICSFIELDIIHFEISGQVLKMLETINRYLKKIIKASQMYCQVEFYGKGQGPFSQADPAIKTKAVFKI